MLSPLRNLALQDDVRIKVQSNTRQYGHRGDHTKCRYQAAWMYVLVLSSTANFFICGDENSEPKTDE